MNFIYSFYPPYHPISSNFYSLMSYQQQQLQPTTLIIPNFQTFSDLGQKNDSLYQGLNTQASSLHQPDHVEPKKQPKLQRKPLKKENGRTKDQNFGWRNQSKDRNLHSTILKGYAQFALNTQRMIKLVEGLSKKLGLENGVSSFYKFIADAFPQKRSYVGIKYMKELLRDGEVDRDTIYMIAVTLRCYLNEVYPLSLCQGSKLKKKEKLSLLKKVRSITAILFQQ